MGMPAPRRTRAPRPAAAVPESAGDDHRDVDGAGPTCGSRSRGARCRCARRPRRPCAITASAPHAATSPLRRGADRAHDHQAASFSSRMNPPFPFGASANEAPGTSAGYAASPGRRSGASPRRFTERSAVSSLVRRSTLGLGNGAGADGPDARPPALAVGGGACGERGVDTRQPGLHGWVATRRTTGDRYRAQRGSGAGQSWSRGTLPVARPRGSMTSRMRRSLVRRRRGIAPVRRRCQLESGLARLIER